MERQQQFVMQNTGSFLELLWQTRITENFSSVMSSILNQTLQNTVADQTIQSIIFILTSSEVH